MVKKDEQFDTDHLLLDVRHLAQYLFDVGAGARQGLRVEQEGFRETIDEVRENQKNYGERAGISQRDFEALLAKLEQREEIAKHLYRARKITERLEESYAVTDDQLQRIVFGIAHIVEARAKAFGDTDLLSLYERVRAYRSAVGLKAARTRRRNENELGDPENEELPEVPEQPEELPEVPAVEAAR